MTNEKLITFLVPCFNSQNFLVRCINSLLQAGADAEILIIDDGSTDSTAVMADCYAGKYPDRVKVIHQENAGHGGCINTGIENATGKFFKVIDSDDWLQKGALKRFINLLRSFSDTKEPDMIVTNYCFYHENRKRNVCRWVRFLKGFPEDTMFEWRDIGKFNIITYLMLHCLTYKLKFLKESLVKLPKKVAYDDNYLLCYMLPKCKKMYYKNLDLYVYTLGHPEQSMSESSIKKKYSDMQYVTGKILGLYSFEKLRKEDKKLYYFMKRETTMLIKAYIFFGRRLEKNGADYLKLVKSLKEFYHINKSSMKLAMLNGMGIVMCVPGPPGRAFIRGPIATLLQVFVDNLP